MDKQSIERDIKYFFSVNQTEEYKMYSFKDIFGSKYESEQLHSIIGDNISQIKLDDRILYLGIWDGFDGLFYIQI